MKKPGHIVLLVIGIVLSLLGFTMAAAGAAGAWFASSQDDGAFFTSPTERYTVSSRALVSPQLDAVGEGTPERLPFDVGTLRLRATATEAGREVFIGIAPQNEVDGYLAGVHHTELREVKFQPFRPVYRDVPGSSTPAAPGAQQFWAASASGPGEQELTWNIAPGNWTVVVMNTDASSGVSADLQAGFRSDLIKPAAMGLLSAGVLAILVGVPLLVLGAVGLGRGGGSSGQLPSTSAAGHGASAGTTSSALHFTGQLDPALSPWMWLVKWFLAIPHFFVLFFLWFAFAVTSIIAWFAILFTGRYPLPLFHFNVGVLRWTWRVAFYTYGAGGTDHYPPFSLSRTDYPANLEVDYPARLSRGLALIKSWLLLIPHLLIVGAFTGTATWAWRTQDGPAGVINDRGGGLSLLGLLVLIALLTLLFTGSYPRPLFAFIMGINRWVYRVLIYGALLRDEYPPFRLDQGAFDPEPLQPPHTDGTARQT
ncbi:DUF4389 domain-containing protein [Paenarthrobacter histidinolovorans]|uniref:DUF4389 domain-containing protein n=1 Tax=Paenarthrobacter histidinolovorans TaxID=43664 RepID=UPI00166B4904|nr:DUF4389 domain-containing protein [Paenarthrobacter histidinolovorans]GGJ23131.1 hypothetical protein GCM10010052_20290 [Paenarthrobacter histidinolovorans]